MVFLQNATPWDLQLEAVTLHCDKQQTNVFPTERSVLVQWRQFSFARHICFLPLQQRSDTKYVLTFILSKAFSWGRSCVSSPHLRRKKKGRNNIMVPGFVRLNVSEGAIPAFLNSLWIQQPCDYGSVKEKILRYLNISVYCAWLCLRH